MDYEGFAKLVEQAAGIDREAAELAMRAVIETIGERLGWHDATALAGQLPHELRPWLEAAPHEQPFGRDEFIRRVAERERVDPATAGCHASAVYTVLGQALDGSPYRRVLVRLKDLLAP